MNSNRFFTLETEAREIFIQLPKAFFMEDSKYYKMSLQAKTLYGILRDRNNLSIKNGWVDSEGKIFFIFAQNELSKILGVNVKTLRNYLKELEKNDLLFRKRSGATLVDTLYLLQAEVSQSQSYQLMGKNYPSHEKEEKINNSTEKTPEIKKVMGKNYPSRQVKITLHDGAKLPPSNNELNNNKLNNTESSSSSSIKNICDYLSTEINITTTNYYKTKLKSYLDQELTEDLIIAAINEAAASATTGVSIKYICAILDRYLKSNIKTIEDLNLDKEKFIKSKNIEKSKTSQFTNYGQRSYDFKNLENKLLGWDQPSDDDVEV